MVSIIVPTYNRASLLPRTLKSIQNQKFQNWELIIMDDGSTDDTFSVVKPFLADERIRYFKKENTGATHSRNEGVKYASYEWITFFDSDDEAKEDWLLALTVLLAQPKVGTVCCGSEFYNQEGKRIGEMLPTPHTFFPDVTARFTSSGSFILLKEIFQNVGGYDPDLRSSQHTELFLRIIPYQLKYGYSFENLFVPLVKIHHHEGERIRKDFYARYLGSTLILEKHKAIIMKNKEKYLDYVSGAGVSAIKSNKIKEGKKLLLKAITINPYKGISYFRFFVSHFPLIRRKMWKNPKMEFKTI